MEFKEGDKVKVKRRCTGTIKGEIYTLTYGNKLGGNKQQLWAWKDGKIEENTTGCFCQENWELVEPKTILLRRKMRSGFVLSV